MTGSDDACGFYVLVRTGTSTSNPRRGVPDDPPPVLPTFPSAEQLFAVEQPVPRASAGAAPSATNELLTFEPTVEQVRSPNRRRRRRRRTSSESSCCCEEAKSSSVVVAPAEDWTQVGANLRKIADDFYASVGKVSPSGANLRPPSLISSKHSNNLLGKWIF